MRPFRALVLLLLAAVPAFAHADCKAVVGDTQYTGRYAVPDGTVLLVYSREKLLIARPIFRSAEQVLSETSPDHFEVANRPKRKAVFERDEDRCVVAMAMSETDSDGRLVKLADADIAPVELLFADRAAEAARRFGSSQADIERGVEFGMRIVERFPSHARTVRDFLTRLAETPPAKPETHAQLEFALAESIVRLGERKTAAAHYARALSLAPARADIAQALARVRGPEITADGIKLPFSMDALFAPPSDAERKAVLADWQHRELKPRDVQVIKRVPYNLGNRGKLPAEIVIISHRVHGGKHYGAIIVPKNATPGCCAVVLDVKGVSWNYFPLNLTRPSNLMQALADDGDRFIYVVPSLRGEKLILGDESWVSEGDRTNDWDGATDDAIALLNVTLKITPEADPARIAAFGHSRGGTVVLLAAERDPRIRRVVSMSGPTDHFFLQGEDGWTPRESVADALRNHGAPKDLGGQFLETFLAGAIAGEKSLNETRHLLLASSPRYFAERLPLTQFHYGLDDGVVPPANGREIIAPMRKAGLKPEAYFYPGFGHDTDVIAAAAHLRRFLMGMGEGRQP
jgi:pimeloyl-ACP methyl ester carboxylesterase